jgi:hypothetical protein
VSEKIKQDALNFIFDYTREAPERQLQDAQNLDNKIAQIFSAASVVIGLAGLASPGPSGGWADWLLVVGLVFYLITAIVALLSQFPKVQWRSLHADVLWREYWQTEVPKIKHALAENIQKAYGQNNRVLEQKSLAIKVVVVATGAEVLLVGLGLILSRVV